jgi:uncharacterized membrane protein
VCRYDWLLAIHVLAAFALLSGAVAAGVFQLSALRRERPSEIALLLRMARITVLPVAVGSIVVLAFGLWLVDETGYGWGETWIVAALVLWVAALVLGGAGGRTARHARELAERLAAAGDEPSDELRALVAHRPTLLLSYLSTAAVVAIVVLMVWKPGA